MWGFGPTLAWPGFRTRQGVSQIHPGNAFIIKGMVLGRQVRRFRMIGAAGEQVNLPWHCKGFISQRRPAMAAESPGHARRALVAARLALEMEIASREGGEDRHRHAGRTPAALAMASATPIRLPRRAIPHASAEAMPGRVWRGHGRSVAPRLRGCKRGHMMRVNFSRSLVITTACPPVPPMPAIP